MRSVRASVRHVSFPDDISEGGVPISMKFGVWMHQVMGLCPIDFRQNLISKMAARRPF